MDILALYPSIKETIWGGRALINNYGFDFSGENAAEAWMLSCHKDGSSVVLNGEYKGKSLSEAIQNEGAACLGTNCSKSGGFPVLIKLIDAREALSVQVHPDDRYARIYENENGKTEAWLILECDAGASLIYGVKRDMRRDEFVSAIKDGTLTDCLKSVRVHPGDVVFIPSGTLHAIGAGILMAEVQQNSNTTYRVFDYNRKDKNGNTRPLHIERAVDVACLKAQEADFSPAGDIMRCEGAELRLLAGCKYFNMYSVQVNGLYKMCADEKSFVSLIVLDGEGVISSDSISMDIKKGSSLFIPANYGSFSLSGKLSLLKTTV